MAAYTGTFNLFQSFNEYKSDGTIDLDDTTANRFMVLLLDSTLEPAVATNTVLADIVANEIAATGGYARQDIANITWTKSGAVMTWNGDDVAWTASGADFAAARWFVVFDDSSTGVTDALIGYGLIDNTPADVTVTDGTTLTLNWNVGGLITSTIT